MKANKREFHAYYQGVCDVASAVNEGGHPLSYINSEELREFIKDNPANFEVEEMIMND